MIALLDGFVIVSALDLGAPPLVVVAAAFVAVAAGHHALARTKRNLGRGDG